MTIEEEKRKLRGALSDLVDALAAGVEDDGPLEYAASLIDGRAYTGDLQDIAAMIIELYASAQRVVVEDLEVGYLSYAYTVSRELIWAARSLLSRVSTRCCASCCREFPECQMYRTELNYGRGVIWLCADADECLRHINEESYARHHERSLARQG